MRDRVGCIPDNSIDLLSAILQSTVGCRANAIEHIRGLGMSNSVSVAETAQGNFVIRTNEESHLFRFQREAWCFKELKSTPVLTPDVIACGILGGFSYSVAPFIADSRPIGSEIDQLRVWQTLGRYARYLNQIKPPSPESDAALYFPNSWEEQVGTDVDTIFKDDLWLANGLLSPKKLSWVKEYLLTCASIEAPRGICQFDLTIANSVICNGNYDKIHLLDLEWANIAPVPYYQLACIAADQGPESEVTKNFYQGYVLDHEELVEISSTLERFTLYRLMRATAWARDRFPSLLEENLRRTKPLLLRLISPTVVGSNIPSK